MRAIIQRRYRGPSSVELADVPVPTPDPGEALVRVHASSVNAADVEILNGYALVRMASPFRPANRIVGSDVSGVVERVGAGVTELTPGDEVVADLSEFGYGAFAELVSAPVRAWHPKPARLTHEEAAAVPSAAWVAIKGIRDQVALGSGSEALIIGAGGGMGTFAIQMAKARGATVTGVDRAAKLELVRSTGADHVVDFQAEDVTQGDGRYDLILDIQAHRSIRDYRPLLKPGGAYCMVGGSTWRILQGVLLGHILSGPDGVRLGIMPGWPHTPRDMDDVDELIASGAVQPVVDRVYPLEEAAAALQRVADGEALGKVVVRVAGE